MTTMLSLILAFMLSIGGSPAVSVSPVNSIGPESGVSKDITEKPLLGEISKIRLFEPMLTAQKARMISLFRINFKKSLLVGYNYYRNRYYMPRIGRFLQTDPTGYMDSMNLYQAFNQNPVNFVDPFGKDVLGRCHSSYQHFLNPSENEEIIKSHLRANALVAEGIVNAALKTFLIPAKYLTLPARLMFGFDFDVNVNFTRVGSVIGGYLGKQSRVDIVKEQTVVFPLADFVTQTGHDVYFGLFYQGGKSSIGKSSREYLARSSGALGFNFLFWGSVYKSLKTSDTSLFAAKDLKSGKVPFDLEKLKKIKESLKKEGVTFWMDESAERNLKNVGASAGYLPDKGKPGIIVLKQFPSRTEVIEELMHLGDNRRLNWQILSATKRTILEISAQYRLINLGKKFGWNIEEINSIKSALSYWYNELSKLE